MMPLVWSAGVVAADLDVEELEHGAEELKVGHHDRVDLYLVAQLELDKLFLVGARREHVAVLLLHQDGRRALGLRRRAMDLCGAVRAGVVGAVLEQKQWVRRLPCPDVGQWLDRRRASRRVCRHRRDLTSGRVAGLVVTRSVRACRRRLGVVVEDERLFNLAMLVKLHHDRRVRRARRWLIDNLRLAFSSSFSQVCTHTTTSGSGSQGTLALLVRPAMAALRRRTSMPRVERDGVLFSPLVERQEGWRRRHRRRCPRRW